MSLSRFLCLTSVAGLIILAGFSPTPDLEFRHLATSKAQQTALSPLLQTEANDSCGDPSAASFGPCMEPSGWA